MIKHAMLVSFLSVLSAVQTSVATASCGDYLHHEGFDHALLGMQLDPPASKPGSPYRCKNGNCRSQDSAPLPTKSHERVVKDRSDMSLEEFKLSLIVFVGSRIPSNEIIPSQPLLDVADPPPRHSV